MSEGYSRVWDFIRWLLSAMLTLALIGASALGIYNVFGDATEVMRLASEAACEGQSAGCSGFMTRGERWPIGHTYDMVTPRGTKTVKCHREYYLIGEYHCSTRGDMLSGTPEAPTSSAPAAATTKPPSKPLKPSAPAKPKTLAAPKAASVTSAVPQAAPATSNAP